MNLKFFSATGGLSANGRGSASGVKFFFSFILVIILTLGLSISYQSLLAAWSAPLANPATCLTGNPGCDEPLNAGSLLQTKSGALWINTGGISPYGLIVENGKVGIGVITPTAALDIQNGNGIIRQKNLTTMVTGTLSAVDTQAKRFEIARVAIDYLNWNAVGPIEIDLDEVYWSQGLKKKYYVYYGYISDSGVYLAEVAGKGNSANNFQVSIGSEVVVSGNTRYIPIYVDVRNYGKVVATLKTNRYLTASNPPPIGYIWVNSAPAGSDITDFAADTTVYMNNVAGYNSIFNMGKVGIGTASPAAKLQVKPETGVEGLRIISSNYSPFVIRNTADTSDLFRIDQNGSVTFAGNINPNGTANYVPSNKWTIGSGSVSIFNQNGDTTENSREWGMGPHGNRTILWKGGNDAASDADGGWGTNGFSINHTKTYRFTTWVKRTGGANGSTYLGCLGSNVTLLNGAADNNPYFYCGALPELDKWYLMVGYIHGSGDSSVTSYGGLYDGVTGKKVISFNAGANCATDYKFNTSATQQQHRTYLYYSTDTNVRQFWWDPRVEEVNGSEPTIEALLGLDKGATAGSAKYFGGNVGIGTDNPGQKLVIQAEDLGIPALGAAGGSFSSLVGGVRGLISGNSSAGNYFMQVQRIDGTATAYNLQLQPNGGNVGINTVSPAAKLQVYNSAGGAAANETIRSQGKWTGVGDGSLIRFTNQHNSGLNPNAGEYNLAGIAGIDDNSAWGGSLRFLTAPTGTTGGANLQTRMTISPAGNVGIGVTNPAAKLQVNPGTNVEGVRIITSNYSPFIIRNSTDTADLFRIDQNGNVTGGNAGGWTRSGGNLYPTDLSDKVGIGTTAPGEKLEVSGNIKLAGGVRFSAASSAYFDGTSFPAIFSTINNSGVYPFDGSIYNNLVIQARNNKDIVFATGASPAVSAVITSGGNVGIGTIAPTSKLGVTSNSLGAAVTGTSGLTLANTTAAAAGAQQISPSLNWTGRGWATTPAASQTGSFISYLLPVQGSTNSSANLIFASSINGGAYSTRLTLTSGGSLVLAGSLSGATTGAFSNTITDTRTGLAGVSTDGVILTNTSGSTAVSPVQMSPRLRLSGTVWDTGAAASRTTNFKQEVLPVSGNPGRARLLWGYDYNAGGYAELMTLTSVGNVGIGVTNPAAKLQVNPGTNVEGVRIITSNYSPFIIRNSTDTADLFRIDQDGNVTGGNAGGWTKSGNNLYPTDLADKVGIGTTGPTAKLTIGGTGSQSINRDRTDGALLLAGGGDYTNSAYFQVTGKDNTGSPGLGSAEFVIRNSAGANDTERSKFALFSTDGASWTERFKLYGNTGEITMANNGGNVGIGTTGPGHKLDIRGSSTDVAQAIGVGVNGLRHWVLSANAYNATKDKYDFELTSPDYAGDLLINNNGNVGIGTASPSKKLDVTGQINASAGLCIAGDCKTSWSQVAATSQSQAFTSSGVFTVPADVTVVYVTLLGGGGGGRGGVGYQPPSGGTYNGLGGGGGGSGEYKYRVPVIVTPGVNVTVTIGSAGAGGGIYITYEFGTGGGGAATTFGGFVSAAGGYGGHNNPGVPAAGGGSGGATAAGTCGTVTSMAYGGNAGALGGTSAVYEGGSTSSSCTCLATCSGGAGGAGCNHCAGGYLGGYVWVKGGGGGAMSPMGSGGNGGTSHYYDALRAMSVGGHGYGASGYGAGGGGGAGLIVSPPNLIPGTSAGGYGGNGSPGYALIEWIGL